MNQLKQALKSLTVPTLVALFAVSVPNQGNADLPAFPGAEGFGKYATGGRGGSVYYVTNLNNSGPGSFRDAVSQSNRTVVFAVSGVIDFQAPRYNVSSNVTIAGQTAPGDGVVLYGDGIGFSNAHNSITRFMRFRMGVDGTSNRNAMTIARGNDMIFDHVSTSWGRDETFSINPESGFEINRITIQNTIIAQGLLGHSAGSLIQTEGGVSIIGSLYHSNDTRNPRARLVTEFVNNVVYNWSSAAYILGDSAGASHGNAFGNYFINGPSGSGAAFTRGNTNYNIFAQDNWHDSNRNGILDGRLLTQSDYGTVTWREEPFDYPFDVEDALPAGTALKSVISKVGASIRRDEVDEQLLRELESFGEMGQLIANEFEGPMNGPGEFRSGHVYTDTSQDGMPDFWKQGTGQNVETMNNNDPSPTGSGYTRLEDYLNWLAEPHGVVMENTPVHIDLRQFTRGFLPFGPEYTLSDAENGTVTLVNDHLARFDPDEDFEGPAAFTFTVEDEDGDTMTRTMNLFFTPLAHTGKVIWKGDDFGNTWNTDDDPNWFDGRSLRFPFRTGDEVTFDASGSPEVVLDGSVEPSLVTVIGEQDYVFDGDGSLDGIGELQKRGSGTLTIHTDNGFEGDTTLEEGALILHGELTDSHVTAQAGTQVGGSGTFGGGLTLESGAALLPGGGIDEPGTVTIGGGLTLSNGSTVHLDLSDDPSGEEKTNDLVQIEGDFTLAGPTTLQVNLMDGPPGDSTFTLFTYTGGFQGDIEDFELLGAAGELTHSDGAIELVVTSERPTADIVWAGDNNENIWDTGETPNWRNDGVPDFFFFLDSVLFDDDGSTSPPVQLVGNLSPSSVTVDAVGDYTFEGNGSITGSTGITKRGEGTLTILAQSDYTGPTVVEEGVLAVVELSGAGQTGPIGAANAEPENFVIGDAEFHSTGGAYATNRGITLDGDAVLNIGTSSGDPVTLDGEIAGSGSLIKRGPRPLRLTAENSFSGGTVIEEGELALHSHEGAGSTTANNHALGSGSVTFRGGTLRLYGGGLGDAGPGYGTFSNNMVVPEGETGTVLTPGRYHMNNTLTGSGTLNLEANYVRGRMGGNWSQFAGLINVTAAPQSPGNGQAEFRVNNSNGYGNATIFLNDGVNITRQGGSSTIHIGALGGTSGGRIQSGNQNSSGTSYVIGANNEDATFAGRLQNDGNTVTFTKVGSGTWTLTGDNTYSGGTTINGGTILANNSTGSALGSGNVSVNNGATLGGTGSVSGVVTVANGGALLPGGENDIGSLSVFEAVLNPGSTSRFRIDADAQANDVLNVQNSIELAGTLQLELVGAGTPASGDSFLIIPTRGAFGDFDDFDLPALAPGLEWDTGEIATTGTVHVTGEAQEPDPFDPGHAEIELTEGGTGIAVRIRNSSTDHNYRLQASDTLEPGSWENVGEAVPGNGDELDFTEELDTENAPRRFYRIVVDPI